MVIPRRFATVVLTLVFAAGIILSTGCTKYASSDDLQRLEEARKAAVSAEQELDRLKADRKKVEGDLADAEAELQEVQKELDYVRANLKAAKMEATDE
jgi:septal ring factor EnvC (AmiA/AmiB activator)